MKKILFLLLFIMFTPIPTAAGPEIHVAGGSGAPTDAHYLTDQAEAGLSDEVVVSAAGKALVGAATYAAMRSQFEVAPMNISFTYNAPIATDDFLIGEAFTQACTVTNYGGVLQSGTSLDIKLYICDGTNDLNDPIDIPGDCDACDSAFLTLDGGEDREAAPDGTVAVGVGDRLAVDIDNVVAPGFFAFDVNLTVD